MQVLALATPLKTTAHAFKWGGCWLALCALGLAQAQAQDPSPTTLTPAPAQASASLPTGSTATPPPLGLQSSAPAWSELTSSQRAALAPLALYWPQLSPQRKRKWLAVSSRFDQLSDEEKVKLQVRMTEWVQLSAQERNQARLNFNAAPKLSNDEKLAHWQAYQSLSEEDRQKFLTNANPKPKGAATVIKPVAPQKLTPQPSASQLQNKPKTALFKIKETAKIDVSPLQLNSQTLLPKTKPL